MKFICVDCIIFAKGNFMPVKIFVSVNDLRWNRYNIDFAKIVNVTIPAALAHDKTEGVIKKSTRTIFPWMPGVGLGAAFGNMDREVSIVLADDRELRALNKKYRGIDRPTNVLSFETGDSELLGDIFISYDTVMRESDAKSFAAHAAHMVVHGVLHLMGYDHLKNSDAEKMETLEARIMKKLGLKNPYEERANAQHSRANCHPFTKVKGILDRSNEYEIPLRFSEGVDTRKARGRGSYFSNCK